MKKIQRIYDYTYKIVTETEEGDYRPVVGQPIYHGETCAVSLANKLQRNDPDHKYAVVRIPELVKTYKYEG